MGRSPPAPYFSEWLFGKRIYKGRLFTKVSLRRHVGQQNLPKNLPKIFPKSSKISPKSFQNRRLGRVLGALGASWGCLGASWGVFGCLGGVLGRLVAVLGASWGVLARRLKPLQLYLGVHLSALLVRDSASHWRLDTFGDATSEPSVVSSFSCHPTPLPPQCPLEDNVKAPGHLRLGRVRRRNGKTSNLEMPSEKFALASRRHAV